MTEETIFTKIANKELPAEILYEDENHIVILDIFPFEKGHTLVIPKKPYITVMNMPEDEYVALMRLSHKVAKHIEKELDCGINVNCNNKPIAEQEVPHVHIHIVPRYEKKKMYRLSEKVKYLPNEMEIYKKKLEVKDKW